MEFLFGLFPILFLCVFGLAFYTIISGIVADAKRKKKNDASPRLTVQATVVTKREEMLRHRHNTDTMRHNHYSTRYYATFQFESGDRLELPVEGFEYGMLVEGDRGRLSFQGTRFLGFERG